MEVVQTPLHKGPHMGACKEFDAAEFCVGVVLDGGGQCTANSVQEESVDVEDEEFFGVV